MQGVIQNQRQAVLREVEGQKEQLDKVSTLLEKLKLAGYTKVGGFAREPGRLWTPHILRKKKETLPHNSKVVRTKCYSALDGKKFHEMLACHFSLFFWDNSGLDLQTFFRTRVVPGRVLGKASQLPGGQEAERPGHAVAKCCAGYRGCNALFHGVLQQGRAVWFIKKLRRCNSWILTPFIFTSKNRRSMICFHTALISTWKLSVDNMVLLLSISWSLVKLQVLRALDLRLLACHHILLEDFPKNLLEVRGHGVQLRGREDLARPKLEAKIRHQETTLCKASLLTSVSHCIPQLGRAVSWRKALRQTRTSKYKTQSHWRVIAAWLSGVAGGWVLWHGQVSKKALWS